ncbi:MAG: carboxypeptidase regulatory-like domain-containing protein [Acidobacteriota bacterium]
MKSSLSFRLWPAGVGLLLIFGVTATYSQSQALDAQIEGVVSDPNGSVVPNALVTAINGQTGAKRAATTNADGIFRFPILTLGMYTIIAESPKFKRSERRGVELSAGQTAWIDIFLEPGAARETVTVTSDAAIADGSKFEIGHHVNARDVEDLPLVSRNPYNFILLQPGVHGRTVADPLAIDMSANGLRRRVSYQIDGGYNNEANLSGFRLTFVSETFVKEVQLLTRGYSAEFGNTAGAIVNVVTRSGTNHLDGTMSVLYRPDVLSAKPFGFERGSADPNVNGYGTTATLGGPVIKDRWQFYAGYEWLRRETASPVTISAPNRLLLIAAGLDRSIFENSEPTRDTQPYFIVRTDAEISEKARVSFRYNRFDAGLRNLGAGNLNTTERSTDRVGYDHAFAAQSVTAFSERFFNEFRYQYASRVSPLIANSYTGSGPSISISNVANFGPSPSVGSIGPEESTSQFQDIITKVFREQTFKIGGGLNFIHDQPTSNVSSSYIFPDIQSYINAANGTKTRGYSLYSETFGDSKILYRSTFLHFFIQDDWNLTRRLKIAIGLRYEMYVPPAADAESPLPYSRKFSLDKNNFAPRLGLVFVLHDGEHRSILRLGSGMHYDPPLLTMYRRAILNNGNPRYFSFSFNSTDPRAPAFPNKLEVFPAGTAIPPRDVDAVSSDFETMYAIHSNFQIEQALTANMSLEVAFVNSIAKHVPVYRNINCLPTGHTLADGRPIYGTSSKACSKPVETQFRRINIAESAGSLKYDALLLRILKRFSSGFQLSANYTLSRATDDAPEDNGPGSVTQSDPSNRGVDKGSAYGDVRSSFSAAMVARPTFHFGNRFVNALVNNNQVSFMAFADSGENFNITTADLNLDGVLGPDRPVGINRNSGRLPAYFGMDARYSRYFKPSDKWSFEFYAEATNVFNSKQVSGYNGTTLSANNSSSSIVDPVTGELRGPLPVFTPNWRDSRQVQLGARIHF